MWNILRIEIRQWTYSQPAHLAVRLSVISDQSTTLQTSKVTGVARRGHTNAGSQLVRTAALKRNRSNRVPKSPGKFISRELTTLVTISQKMQNCRFCQFRKCSETSHTLQRTNKPVFSRRGWHSLPACSPSACEHSRSLFTSRPFTTVHLITWLSVHLIHSHHPNNRVTKSSCNAIQQDQSTVGHCRMPQPEQRAQGSFGE